MEATVDVIEVTKAIIKAITRAATNLFFEFGTFIIGAGIIGPGSIIIPPPSSTLIPIHLLRHARYVINITRNPFMHPQRKRSRLQIRPLAPAEFSIRLLIARDNGLQALLREKYVVVRQSLEIFLPPVPQ